MAETANSSLISSSILKRRVILAILAVILQWSKSVWAQGATIETLRELDDIKSKYLCQNLDFLYLFVICLFLTPQLQLYVLFRYISVPYGFCLFRTIE